MDKYIGIDISKASLQVHVPEEGLDWVIPNDLKGMKSLWQKLKKRFKKESQDVVFIFEATGGYSYRLKRFCLEKSIRCFIVNPRQSANFAKAQGERNKSDPIDARLLSSMHVLAKPGQIKVPQINEEVELLKEYMSYFQGETQSWREFHDDHSPPNSKKKQSSWYWSRSSPRLKWPNVWIFQSSP